MAVPNYVPANVIQNVSVPNLSTFLPPIFPSLTSTLLLPQVSTFITPISTSDSTLYANNMVIDAWADEARRSYQGVEEQGAIETLRHVFEGKEDSDKAASRIASIYDPLLQRGFKISPVAQLWTLICEAVKALGSDKEIDMRLVDLLNAISKLPDVLDKDGKPITGGEMAYSKVYWRDLPSLTMIFREYAMGKS